MNVAEIVRTLVIDGGIPYESVMRMTPNQLLVLAIGHESDAPDRIRRGTMIEIARDVAEYRKAAGY